MSRGGRQGVHLRKKVRTAAPEPEATPLPDLLRRDFTTAEPNTRCFGNITHLPIGDGQFLSSGAAGSGARAGGSPTMRTKQLSPMRSAARTKSVVARDTHGLIIGEVQQRPVRDLLWTPRRRPGREPTAGPVGGACRG